jgi:hypothetical protein
VQESGKAQKHFILMELGNLWTTVPDALKMIMCLQSTYQEKVPARDLIHTHMQKFSV